MALQSSGEISFADIQNEYGGSNPISLSEYYKDGSYVPSSIFALGTMSNEIYQLGVYWCFWNDTSAGGNGFYQFEWNNSVIRQGYSSSRPSYTDSGGYRYWFGSLQSNNVSGYQDWHAIKRQTAGNVTVNSNVPTSGTLSLSNHYGGRKT